MPTLISRLAVLGVLAAYSLVGAQCSACSVPVFRYALDRWPADPYDILVFYRGELSESDQAALKALDERDLYEEGGANFLLTKIDVSKELKGPVKEIWEAQKNPELPWAVIRYPRYSRIPVPLWTGKLADVKLDPLIDSPVRQQVAKEILGGAASVWVLLEGEDKAQNETARKTLEETLKQLAEEIELPPLDPYDPYASSVADGEEALKVSFPVLEVKRSDPAEKVFVDMLLGTEEDLRTFKEPIAIPVFGRGRALFALVGKGINAENLTDACTFVCGACSCEIKQLNPGVDLLMKIDWDRELQARFEPAIELVEPETKNE